MSRIAILLLYLLILSCNQEKKVVVESDLIQRFVNDSVAIITNHNNKITCIYTLDSDKNLKEKIEFLSNGTIDYSKSTFLEKQGSDLYFRSKYDGKYPIPKKRFVEFITVSDTIFFGKNGEVINYEKVLPRKGKIIETIFIDTIVKVKGSEDNTVIRTIEYQIDLEDLLSQKLHKYKVN